MRMQHSGGAGRAVRLGAGQQAPAGLVCCKTGIAARMPAMQRLELPQM
jgi:hypothetical protein